MNKKAIKKVRNSYNQCLTCRRPCSMSGLCMRPWPEFEIAKRKGDGGIRGERKSG